MGISRDVLIFSQWVVQQVEVLDSAFGHQVEEVLLHDGDIVVQRRINGRLTVLSRSYNLYSDVQRADDIVGGASC